MDLSKSAHRKPEDARAEDPAIMLFGKQITNLSSKDADNIKEELSPRGVDEKGLSFATSSDDEEDLNPTCEDDVLVKQSASPVIASVLASALARGHARKRKAVENECVAPRDKDAAQPKSNASGPITLRMGGDNRAGKLKGGMSIRCPRCNSADTKFCYFNNYNVSQPRHFCKHCQRYWTAGGTLRNVPIGAGKRKNKHALHKHNFAANSTSELTVPKTSLPVGVADADPLSIAKSEPLPTSESKPLSIEETNPVNTNLELSAHHSFTDSPMPSLSPCNIAHPQSAHKLITLHQAHENLQSRLGQINHPHLATGCSKLGQIYPNLACGSSPLSPIHPELAGGCSKLGQFYADSASGSPGLSQISPFVPNGSYGLSQICPHLCGGFPGLHQICPGLRSEFARLGPHLQTGSSRLCYTDPHVQGGACKTSQECLDYKRDELSGLAKSERGFSEIDESKGNFESELPMSDQKKASLERGLPDSARTALEKGNLENKARASCLQIGHPELDPMEVDNYMQRLNEMKSMRCSASSNECKGHMRGACNGLMETKAPPLHAAQVSSNSALRIESQEGPFHIETIMKRGTVGEEHMSFPIWASLWPYFYNMLWLDPLAFPHLRPILTPQGWALPFIPPSASKIEPPPNNSPHNVRTPTTCVLENFDSSSTTLTTTTSTLSAPFTGACNIATTSPARKCYPTPTTTTSLGNFEHVSGGGTCNVAPKALH